MTQSPQSQRAGASQLSGASTPPPRPTPPSPRRVAPNVENVKYKFRRTGGTPRHLPACPMSVVDVVRGAGGATRDGTAAVRAAARASTVVRVPDG